MNKQNKLHFTKEKLIRYLLSLGMVFLMCFTAEILGEKEIIFPEIAALTVGAWLIPQTPWNVSRPKMIILMTLAALMGIIIVNFIPLAMPIKLLLGFIFAAVCLTVSDTTMYPIISACILPIMMNTESIIYPISVLAMTIIIALVNYIMEKSDINKPLNYSFNPPDIKSQSSLWAKRCVIFSAALLPAVITGEYLYLAPPLIVTFVEFSPYNSSKRPLATLICVSLAALIGFGARCLVQFCSLPIWLCACLAILALFIVFALTKKNFPPAGAIALLPLIIPNDKIFLYPIEVIIGCTLLIALDMLFFSADKAEVKSLT